MVYIKKHFIKDVCFAQFYTQDKTILFDCPCKMYGLNRKYPSFKNPPKILKFLVPNQPYVDEILITNSESLGVLFLNHNARIYCTKPVYEQILMRYDELKNLSLAYEEEQIKDENIKLVTIEDVDIERFKRNVIFVTYNQKIIIGSLKVFPLASGTIIGWTNYKIFLPCGKSVIYLTSYSSKPRFSTEAQQIDSDYLLISRKCISFENNLDKFTEFIKRKEYIHPKDNEMNIRLREEFFIDSGHIPGLEEFDGSPAKKFRQFESSIPCISAFESSSAEFIDPVNNISSSALNDNEKLPRTILIPSKIESFFIEVIFHILSIIEFSGIPIYVISPIFNKLELLSNIQSEWLNKDFCTISEPFPIKNYPNLFVVEDFNFPFVDGTKIIFCSTLEYSLLKNSRIFDNQETALLNFEKEEYADHEIIFNIKTETANEEIFENYKGQLIIKNEFYIPDFNDSEIVVLPGNISVFDKHIYMCGVLTKTDFFSENCVSLSFKPKKAVIRELIESGNYSYFDGWMIFTTFGIKCRPLNNMQIEFKCIND